MLLFCLDWAESAALEVLHSSLAKVTCLGLVGWVDVPSLEAEACKVPTDLLGEGRCQSLFFFSSHEAPVVDKLLDCACTKKHNFCLIKKKKEIYIYVFIKRVGWTQF